MKKIFTVLSFLLIFSNSYSNNPNALLFLKKNIVEITDTTVECKVVSGSKVIYKGAELSGFYDSYVKIFGLSDSSVKILKGEVSIEIPINDIKSIKFKGKGFWKGAAIGGGIGLLAGLLLGASFAELCEDAGNCKSSTIITGAFVVGVPFALIGGGLGVLLAKDKIYDLRNLNFESKRKKLKYLIKEYSNR